MKLLRWDPTCLPVASLAVGKNTISCGYSHHCHEHDLYHDVINFSKAAKLVSFLLLNNLIRRDKQTTNYIALKKNIRSFLQNDDITNLGGFFGFCFLVFGFFCIPNSWIQ